MRRLSVLVLSLATVLALAGVTQAKKPEGTPGGPPPKGDDDGPLKVSQFSAPLVDADGEIPMTLAEINSRGDWSLVTVNLVAGAYKICLDAISGPGPKLLDIFNLGNPGGHSASGRMLDGNGNWQAPSFQVRVDNGGKCGGELIQESGIEIGKDGVSKFSAPFLALDEFGEPIGEVESTAQISSSGRWILATSGLKRRQRYDICLFYLENLVSSSEPNPLELADKQSEGSGNLYAKGTSRDINDGSDGNPIITITLQAPSFQIMEEPYDGAPNCDGQPNQETGLFINAPAP